MATPEHQSSPTTAQPILVKKLNSSPSTMSNTLLCVASRNTSFSSLAETWMPKSGKTETTNTAYTSSNRNGQHLTDFMIENRITCLNTNFQKKKSANYVPTYANNTKAQIDSVFMNKKLKNSAVNCEAYSSFVCVSSDHRIVTVKIRLSLRKNATRTTTTIPYDCGGARGGGARGVVVIAVGNEHGDTSSNPGRDWLHFT